MAASLPETCDVIVVGTGAAGLAAAFAAAVSGLEVCLLEKAQVVGGSTALSGGVIWAPGHRLSKAGGQGDPAASALAYLRAEAGNLLDETLARRFLAEVPRVMDFLVAQAGLRLVAPIYPDYHPQLPGWSSGGRTLRPAPFDGASLGRDLALVRRPLPSMTLLGGMMVSAEDIEPLMKATRSWRAAAGAARLFARYATDRVRFGRASRLTNGNALVGGLLQALLSRGVRPHVGVGLKRLLVEQGRVVGAELVRDGHSFEMRARRGVILATGGIPHGDVLPKEPGAAAAGQSLAPLDNTGDGVRSARETGGAMRIDVASPRAWVPVSDVPQADGSATPYPHFFDRSKPGFVIVDRNGNRFASEALSYHDLGPLIAACPGGEAFLIGDATAVGRYGIGAARPWPATNRALRRAGYLVRASSLRELAQRLGIDVERLESTLGKWNQDAASGTDSQFGKGGDAYQRHIGDHEHVPNPCIAPVARPPFFAVRLRSGDIGTFAGLRVDEDARVLAGDGRPIPGLYAAGNDMCSVMAGTYPGPGITLGPALTFGVLAAEAIGKQR